MESKHLLPSLSECKVVAPDSAALAEHTQASWRNTLKIHPACELFPPMSPDDLRALGEDIIKNRLTSPIVLWSDGRLLEGRSRLDAIEAHTGCQVQVVLETVKQSRTRIWSIQAGDGWVRDNRVIVLDGSVDPYAYVMSANVRRRHLLIEDRDRLIVQLLKADPTKSNRAVAKLTDTSHPHVAKVRERAEKSGDVETVSTSVDTQGRQQPAKRGWSRERWARHRAKKSGRETTAIAETVVPAAPENQSHRQDISSGSADEIARKDEGEGSELGNLLRAWDRASQSAREKFKARVGLVATDGLDFPAWMRRTAS